MQPIVHLVLAYCGKILLSGLENNNKVLEKDNSKLLKIVQTELADRFFRLDKECLRRDVTDT